MSDQLATRSAFDHALLVRRHPVEVARFQALFQRVAGVPGVVPPLRVEHEHDDSCCRREPWPVTLAAVLRGETAGGAR